MLARHQMPDHTLRCSPAVALFDAYLEVVSGCWLLRTLVQWESAVSPLQFELQSRTALHPQCNTLSNSLTAGRVAGRQRSA